MHMHRRPRHRRRHRRFHSLFRLRITIITVIDCPGVAGKRRN